MPQPPTRAERRALAREQVAETQRAEAARPATIIQHQTQTFESHSGPLPHPSILRQYDAIVPGAAARLFAMAEEQAHHRHYLERTTLEADIRRADNGLRAGFVVSLAGLIGSVALVLAGHAVAGTVIGTVDLAGLAGTFVYGSLTRRNERLRRAKIMAGQLPEQKQ